MTFTGISKAIAVAALSLFLGSPAMGAIFVYVSNADDGDISSYRMNPVTGTLWPGIRVKAANLVMPMAVSPDRRFLYAAVRSKPYSVMTYSIEPHAGGLQLVSTSPLADSFPYISLDRTGRYLFGASYGAHLVSVNAIDGEGRVSAAPLQVIAVGRNAHSIQVDESNRFAFAATLGSDEIFQFTFDEKTGRLASNTPAVVLLKASTGPRHFVTSRDDKYLYAVNELVGTVTTYALDASTGLLTETGSVSALPSGTKLGPGLPRGAVGGPNAPAPRNTDNDIWAADIHMTPDGKFLYASERTSSTLAAFGVDPATGKLSYLGSTPTEKQPRGFAIDAGGKFLVASGEKSESISVYKIDPSSGALQHVARYPVGKGANWVEIVTVD